MLKTALFAPMPRVSMAKAATANPGLLRKPRTAYTKSLPDNFMFPPGQQKACWLPAPVSTRSHEVKPAWKQFFTAEARQVLCGDVPPGRCASERQYAMPKGPAGPEHKS